MKVAELIEALAGEIEIVRPQLDEFLDTLSTIDANDAEFADTLELYGSQIERTGEAAEMVGFGGLTLVCEHLQKNVSQLSGKPVAERGVFIDLLRRVPDLIVHYLNDLDDVSNAAGLVDMLRDAPLPMSEDQSMRVMHKLGQIPMQMSGMADFDDSEKRPVLIADDQAKLAVPDDVDPRLMESFLQEAPEQVSYLVKLVGNIAGSDYAELSDLTAAKRVVHTIKGTSATIGIQGLTHLGHHFEDILEYFEENEGEPVPKFVVDILIDAAYCMEQAVAHLSGQDDYPEQLQSITQDVLDLANRIDQGDTLEIAIRRGKGGGATVGGAAPAPAQPAPSKQSAALRVNLDRIDELFRVSAEVSVHTAAMEAKIKQLNDHAKTLSAQQLRVKKRLYELETVVDVRTITMMRSMGQGNQSTAFDPLEMEQYNELHSTAHAMVEDANDAIVMSQDLNEEIAQLTTMQTRQQVLSNDLQHLVIGTRMAEVGTLEPRLQRNIRSTGQTTGKLATLSLKGGETLIDSDVLNHLAEPLLHLMRNAVDHGLETPEERLASGKEESGNITLEFSKQGQQVVLYCRDDGRGLDYEFIRNRALERGLIKENETLTDDETARLILASGFSTRDGVTQISGRGVGLDVVAEWVRKMNGEIRIHSQLGQGTTFELRFAASLSTTQALIVGAGQQSFALPSIQVEQALARRVGEFVETKNGLQYHLDDRVIAAKYLADLVGLPKEERELADYSAVIVRVDTEVFALAVDRLIDSRELLVKDPGRYTRYLREVAGVSILGDGSITAHLDIANLLMQSTSRRALPVNTEQTVASVDNRPKILIVDDSLSVRNTLEEFIVDLGYVPKTARDGIEAVDMLNDFQPNVILTDLEMPNMNGVELTSHIRSRADMKQLPIIMITSRSQAKHKELAVQAGVDEYVTKPYNETTLTGLIQQALNAA